MSRNSDWDPFDESEDDNDDGTLVKRLRSEIKARDKTIGEQTEKLSKLESTVTKRDITDVLQSKGVKPGLTRHVLRDLKEDGIDVTPEAVEKWLTDNADEFGIELNPKAPEGNDDGTGGAEGLSEEDAAALRSISATEGSALPPEKEKDLQAKLNDPNLTRAELDRLMGVPAGRT